MVLLHEAGPKGAERIAVCWADNRKVPQVAFKPAWTRHKNAAPFKNNDAMLEALPIGVIVFSGSGIVEKLADKARKLGNFVLALRKGGPMSALNGARNCVMFAERLPVSTSLTQNRWTGLENRGLF